MALALIDHFKPYQMLNGTPFPVLSGTKATGVTWEKGVVLIDASGLLVEAADSPTSGTIIGVALNEGVSGDTRVEVCPALPGVVFSGRMATTGAGAAYDTQITDRYSKFGVALHSSGTWFIDENETSVLAVLILDFIDAIGTDLGKVKFTFMDSVFNHIDD
jgi:hypothetical protein